MSAEASPHERSPLRKWFARRWSLWFVLAIAAVWLCRSPYNVSDLDVIPDSVEYAVGALQFVETGRYEIVVQGRALPPRYPPWFSVIVLAPAYALFGSDPGNGIIPVTLLAVSGIGFAWALGRRISGDAGGVLAALAVLAMPTYSGGAIEIMTDVPCAALMLASCLIYLRLAHRGGSMRLMFAAGVLVALAMLLRPVFAAMALPFAFWILRRRQNLLRFGAALLLPIALAAAATLVYNARVFGSPRRNGYHFWTAVPSDYPELAFSFLYVPSTLSGLLQTALPYFVVLSIAVWFIARRRRPPTAETRDTLIRVATFVGLTAAPITLFHVFYFYPDERFHLALLSGAAVIAGGVVGLLIDEQRARIFRILLPAVLLLTIGARFAAPDPAPSRRVAADRMRQHTPPDAIILSGIDPVYMERLVARGTERRILPFTRHIEYASKAIVRKRIDHPDPPPRGWYDQRAEGLFNGGAEEAVLFVAEEQVPLLASEAAGGRPLFLDTSHLKGRRATEVGDRIEQEFTITERAPKLYELRPR